MNVADFADLMAKIKLELMADRLHQEHLLQVVSEVGAGPVHRELPGFTAFREFCGRHDTCFQDAATSILAALDPSKWSANCVSMNRMANDMLANGRLKDGGTTMAGGVQQLRDYGYTVDYSGWMMWENATDVNLLHQLLIDRSGIDGIVLQVGQAHNLPGNEQGVYSHFVADGGIDSAMGYLIANGDIPLFRFHGTQWVGWANLISAVPTAVCVVHAKAKPVSVIDNLKAAGYTDTAAFDPHQQGRLYASNGFYYTKGIRNAILNDATFDVQDFPRMNEVSDGTVSAQASMRSEWEWSQAGGLVRKPLSPLGLVLAFYANQTHPTASKRQLDAETVIGALAGVLKEF